MSKKLSYLASPYTHESSRVRQNRYEAVCRVAGRLMRDGHLIFSPIAHSHAIAEMCELPGHWEFWQEHDRAMLSACEKLIVLKLPGWDISVGVAAEIELALSMGLPVEFMEFEVF